MNKFEDIQLSAEILRGVSDMGFTAMSEIQEKAIPILLGGEDIIGQSQTGTGKTAAFGIPILEDLEMKNELQAIILCPTRELSIQIANEIRNIGRHIEGLRITSIYGGESINKQIKDLKRGVHIVVGTPGRVIDHIRRKTLKLDTIKTIVLDEADEMFNMGFRDDMEFIINKIDRDRQTVLFSATMDKKIMNFAKKYQKNPKTIRIQAKELTAPKIEQFYLNVKQSTKTDTMCKLMDLNNPELSVVFCNTKRQVDRLVDELGKKGYYVDGLHGDLKQSQRDFVMKRFREGKIDILVATDVAARGIDVDEVDAVFNYDIPEDIEYYVHRIGRTARAGREGTAYNFVTNKDKRKMKDIERYTKTSIRSMDIPRDKDIRKIKINNLLEAINQDLEETDLEEYRTILENNQLGLSMEDIAAYLFKSQLNDDRKEDNVIPVDFNNKSRLYISTGKKMKVSASNILAAFMENLDVESDYIGKIDIYDTFSFIEVPKAMEDKVVGVMDGKKIKGRRVRVEKSNSK